MHCAVFHPTLEVEFWPNLFEKALAKLDGGYAALETGYESYAWRAMTGSQKLFAWRRTGDEWRQYRQLQPPNTKERY